MTSINRTNLILQNNAPVNNEQRRATLLGSAIENIAPPSYEEVINPNGGFFKQYVLHICHVFLSLDLRLL